MHDKCNERQEEPALLVCLCICVFVVQERLGSSLVERQLHSPPAWHFRMLRLQMSVSVFSRQELFCEEKQTVARVSS